MTVKSTLYTFFSIQKKLVDIFDNYFTLFLEFILGIDYNETKSLYFLLLTMSSIKDVTLLDTIWNTCIVKMPKWVFSRFFSSDFDKSHSKKQSLRDSCKEWLTSSKSYSSAKELFIDNGITI